MKIIPLIILFLVSIEANSQVNKIRQIDSLVNTINKSNFKVQKDSTIQERPELGLTIKTYLNMVVNNNELKKYVNYVNAVTQENGVTRQRNTSSTFYYDKNNLIKVEEFIVEGDKKTGADWYYSEDKPLYYTMHSDKSEARAALLLTMSKAMLKQIIKPN